MFKLPATVLCISLIFYLFWTYRSEHKYHSAAIWIPFLFMLFNGSRPLSFWLNYCFGIGSFSASAESLEEGNTFERVYFIGIYIICLVVLFRRKINWADLFINNKIICLYFLFCLVSILWSDYPVVAFKRLVKTIGCAFMAVIVLTEARPYAAIGFIMKRLAFVFLPLSILLIHYYPIGKEFHVNGAQLNIGVAGHKNGLGMLCFLTTAYLAYSLFFVRKGIDELSGKINISTYVILIPMLLWLFYKASSATSLVCAIVVTGIFLIAQKPHIRQNPNIFIATCIGIVLILGLLELAIDIKLTLFELLGRRPDLTTRVPMWYDLISMVRNPLLGFGNESFWLGERIAYIQKHYGPLLQAHNGYLETYLNLGAIGLTLLITWIVSGFMKVLSLITKDYPGAIFRFSLLVVICLFNWTEATLYGKSNMWTLFLFCTIVIPAKGLNTDVTTENK